MTMTSPPRPPDWQRKLSGSAAVPGRSWIANAEGEARLVPNLQGDLQAHPGSADDVKGPIALLTFLGIVATGVSRRTSHHSATA